MESLKIFGFDIVPGTQGSELAYEVSLEKAIVEARNHREILEDDPELAYMLPFPPSEIYEITLWPPTPEILVAALNDPPRLAALLELSRETVFRVGTATAA